MMTDKSLVGLNEALVAGRREYNALYHLTPDSSVGRLVDAAVEAGLKAALPHVSHHLAMTIRENADHEPAQYEENGQATSVATFTVSEKVLEDVESGGGLDRVCLTLLDYERMVFDQYRQTREREDLTDEAILEMGAAAWWEEIPSAFPENDTWDKSHKFKAERDRMLKVVQIILTAVQPAIQQSVLRAVEDGIQAVRDNIDRPITNPNPNTQS